ncbi:hypothetical protein TNCV_2460051 [Trichonephila clavipes]|nr:hypothetical protein TNCV_2460051 [Trichonephila clavipes]
MKNLLFLVPQFQGIQSTEGLKRQRLLLGDQSSEFHSLHVTGDLVIHGADKIILENYKKNQGLYIIPSTSWKWTTMKVVVLWSGASEHWTNATGLSGIHTSFANLKLYRRALVLVVLWKVVTQLIFMGDNTPSHRSQLISGCLENEDI